MQHRPRLELGQLRRAGVGVASIGLCAAGLVGCSSHGGSDTSSSQYCTDVAAAKDSFVGLLDNRIDQQAFNALLPALRTVTAEAPGDVAKDWTTFTRAVTTFGIALHKAGLTMDDLRSMGSGPMGGGPAMQRAMDAARSLGSVAVSNAQSAIIRETRHTCQVNLNA